MAALDLPRREPPRRRRSDYGETAHSDGPTAFCTAVEERSGDTAFVRAKISRYSTGLVRSNPWFTAQ